VDPGVLWISALDLLERKPYGPSIGLRRTTDDETLVIVSNMAAMIAAMALNEAERPRLSHLVYAAELQAALGNHEEVIQLLEQIPPTEDPYINLTEDLVRLIGSETALRLYNEVGGSRPNILLTAASAESDPDRSTAYLERAYEQFSNEKPWPDFDWMERTVKRSADLGHANLTLQLARDLALQAQTNQSAFPVFSHIKATRGLIAAQADESEIRQSLELAEGSFPQNDKEVVGIGVVSGPIVWGRSGLDAQARREIANLRGRLGDIEAAIQSMEGIEDPVFAWNDMLSADIPIEHINALLDAANAVLPTEGYYYVRAQLAAEMAHTDKAEAQRSWALSTATDILQAQQLDGDRAVVIYTSLARVGAGLEAPNIESLALERMAQAALISRDYGDLISAGFLWHQSDITP
jgi:tetratricopeptide (TPR) repeat protein